MPVTPKKSAFTPMVALKKLVPEIIQLPERLMKGFAQLPASKQLPWPAETKAMMKRLPKAGIFLTGIEGSDPWVETSRRNQLKEAFDFEQNYVQRLQRIRELGIVWLRFGIPYSVAHPSPKVYNFELMDKVMRECDRLGIHILADLLHFGLPEWLHEQNQDEPFFQNRQFAEHFASYVRKFAKRYPNIRYFTLVNEPYVTAFLSAKQGLWNEQRKSEWQDDRSFVKAAANIARAAVLGRQEIEKVWQEEKRAGSPVFLQNESFELAETEPGSGREAEMRRFNLRRFTLLDLIFGHQDDLMQYYLLSQGMSQATYDWFMEHGKSTNTVLGIDHYPWCVQILEKNQQTRSGQGVHDYQLYRIAKMYWERYPLPLLHTEVNAPPEQAVEMCKRTYEDLRKLQKEGYPVVGMGWYGDEYQVGWQAALTGPQGYDEYPVGLHYKGEVQPVAAVFQGLLRQGFSSRTQRLFPALNIVPDFLQIRRKK